MLTAALQRVSLSLVALLIAAMPLHDAAADPLADDAGALLAKMAFAVRESNYQGSFLYEHEGRIDTLRIFHAGGRDGRERLVSMNGERRELTHEGDTITCVQPGRGTLLLSTKGSPHLLPLVPAIGGASFAKHYALELGREDRVAGFRARIVNIVPRDDYRYGYRLWLEDSTQMPLRSAVLDRSQRVLEQFMFVSLELGAKPKESDLVSTSDAAALNAPEPSALLARPHWRVASAPPGFEQVRAERLDRVAGGEHLVYSDGVASVSVYVEPRSPNATQDADPHTSRSLINLATRAVDGWKFTVLGDVPRVTVDEIARSIVSSDNAAER